MDFTGLNRLYEAVHIPVCVYEGEDLVFRRPDQADYYFYPAGMDQALPRLHAALREKPEPVLFFEDMHFWYGAFPVGSGAVIFGPTVRETPDHALLRAFREKHHLAKDAQLSRVSGQRMKSALSLACYMLTGTDWDPAQIQVANVSEQAMLWEPVSEQEHYELEKSEYERDHNSMAWEKELFRIVRGGDVDAIEKMLRGISMLDESHIGVVAKESKKQTEYLCVTLISLLARVATEGGMNQEQAYTKADVGLQRLSFCKTEEEMKALTSRMLYEFTAAVGKAKKEDSRQHYVEACKAYIAENLRRPFRVADISETLGLNRSYLARKFSEAEGISIHEYIMKERCEHAANLLRHSDYSIAMIAEYFCFSTQSHFGKVFKDYYGMTPMEYRNRNKRT